MLRSHLSCTFLLLRFTHSNSILLLFTNAAWEALLVPSLSSSEAVHPSSWEALLSWVLVLWEALPSLAPLLWEVHLWADRL